MSRRLQKRNTQERQVKDEEVELNERGKRASKSKSFKEEYNSENEDELGSEFEFGPNEDDMSNSYEDNDDSNDETYGSTGASSRKTNGFPKSRKTISCPVCHRDFFDRSTLRKHMGRQHKDDPMPAPEPRKGQPRRSSFPKKRKKINESGSDSSSDNWVPYRRPTAVCPYCNKTFYDRPSVCKHIKRIHPDKTIPCADPQSTSNNPFICSICKEEFPNKTRLRKHTKASHFAAPEDDEAAENDTKYTMTEKFDSNICPACDKKLYDISTLKKHFKRKHT